MRIHFQVQAGQDQGRVFEFAEHRNFFVGRGKDALFRIEDQGKYVSRLHFMVEVNPPLCRLTDMDSTNGTLVNDKLVQSVDLKHGDVITVGKTVIAVAMVAEAGDSAESLDLTKSLNQNPVADAIDPYLTVAPSASFFSPGRTPTTLDHPARHGSTEPNPSLCRSCSVMLPGGLANPRNEPRLCPSCHDHASQSPQTIPGYRIIRELGRGGMGVVYLALRESDGTRIALKTIKPQGSISEAETQRFLREASILAELDHPNIVAFRERGESAGILYFAMDYVPGVDASRLQEDHGGPMAPDRAVRLIGQLLQALDYAHAKGFVHRDIKPANILINTEAGREFVQLSDFGLARVYQTSKMSGLTLKGDLGGTFAFMAPEQVTDLRDACPPVDQYSAGATLYKLLTNQYIYDLPTQYAAQIQAILFSDPVPIRKRRPDLPQELANVIHRSLARDPNARFQDVQEMKRALAPFG